MQFINKLLHSFKNTRNAKLPEEFLIRWAKRLRFFRYVKARGGFDGDIDQIVLLLRYDGQEDLIALFKDLEIPYKRHLEAPLQPESGKSYSGADFAKFPSVIPGTYWIEQPDWQTIDSVTLSVWCTTDRIRFRIVGPREKHWVITDREFENAERLESIFEKYIQRIIDPPIDAENCICPKYHPQYWEAG